MDTEGPKEKEIKAYVPGEKRKPESNDHDAEQGKKEQKKNARQKREEPSKAKSKDGFLNYKFIYTFIGEPGEEQGKLLPWNKKYLRFSDPVHIVAGDRIILEYVNPKLGEKKLLYVQSPKMYCPFGAKRFKDNPKSKFSFSLSFFQREKEPKLQAFYNQLAEIEEAAIQHLVANKAKIFPDEKSPIPDEFIKLMFKSSIAAKTSQRRDGSTGQYENLSINIPKIKSDYRIWKQDESVEPEYIHEQSWLRVVIYPTLWVSKGEARLSWTLSQADLDEGFRVEVDVARKNCLVDED